MQPFHYNGNGLPNVILTSGFTLTDDHPSPDTTIHKEDNLNRAIGFTIASASHAPILMGPEITFLREQLKFSYLDLAPRLGLSSHKIRFLETDRETIAYQTEALLRMLYLRRNGTKVDVDKYLVTFATRPLVSPPVPQKYTCHYNEKFGWTCTVTNT